MTPEHCRVMHKPEQQQYGDCIRACIASLTDTPADQVPHFVHDNPESDVMYDRVRRWLGERELSLFCVCYPGSYALHEVLSLTAQTNPGIHYMLFGGTGRGDHVVIALNNAIVHNPSWVGGRIVEPMSAGHWQIGVICRP